jgi:pSer/pThr/pTyr-binding forkhead associated (FHA) protein
MDMVEKLNSKFTVWYESLFGDHGNSELRPKDVLRKILHAMDDNRSEGIDGKVYVPNKYILVLNLPDQDERDYLLSFLDEGELSAVLQRYMAQNGYAVRGPLDFTITDDATGNTSAPKLTVKVKYEKGVIEQPESQASSEQASQHDFIDDLPTVAAVPFEDLETVADIPKAWATLAVTEPDGHRSLIALTGRLFSIGRSRTAGNDLILAADGKVSKQHATIEVSPDGSATVTDANSTNGVTVNGTRIFESTVLKHQDIIGIGDSTLVFQQESRNASRPVPPQQTRKMAVLSPMNDGADHVLASDNLIGKAITCDIVLSDASIASRQAQVIAHESGSFTVEDLSGRGTTLVNERVVQAGERIKLTNGDRVQFGPSIYQYLESLS